VPLQVQELVPERGQVLEQVRGLEQALGQVRGLGQVRAAELGQELVSSQVLEQEPEP
jgi:hypothetical protein